MSFVQTPTRNFLVPADGSTHCVLTELTATVQAQIISWKQFSLDYFKFYPQGIYADNTAGATDLTITILPVNYTIVIPAGVSKTVQFPAPSADQTATVVGNGVVRLFWVDYPTFPDSSGVSLSYSPTAPLPVFVPPGFPVTVEAGALAQGGVPYQMLLRNYQPATNVFRIAVTDVASASTDLANLGPDIEFINLGPDAVMVTWADNAAPAAPVYPAAGANQPGFLIAPGTDKILRLPAATAVRVRAICAATKTADLYVQAGVGA